MAGNKTKVLQPSSSESGQHTLFAFSLVGLITRSAAFAEDPPWSRHSGRRFVAASRSGLCRTLACQSLSPPLTAAAVAMVLAWRRAPPLAYIAASLGTLIGADLPNLGKLQGLAAPIASIGGAGSFDGVFLTGIIAVLLPSLGPETASAQYPGARMRPTPEGPLWEPDA